MESLERLIEKHQILPSTDETGAMIERDKVPLNILLYRKSIRQILFKLPPHFAHKLGINVLSQAESEEQWPSAAIRCESAPRAPSRISGGLRKNPMHASFRR